MLKKALLITLALFLVYSVGAAWAVVNVPYDCGEFVRGSGAPVVETVEGIPGISGTTGTLRIINGADDDTLEKVSSSVIIWNGVNLLSQEDFNQNVNELTVEVNLQETNTLSVEVRGKPGGTLSLELIQEVVAEGANFIDTNGGMAKVYDENSNIYGASATFLSNTFEVDTLIKIRESLFPPQLPDGYTSAGVTVEFTAQISLFKKPVMISLPINSELIDNGKEFGVLYLTFRTTRYDFLDLTTRRSEEA